MNYLGDYTEDFTTLNMKFTTKNVSGVPTTLAGAPVISVYKANDLTQSVAGVTLTADFDSITGLNNVLIDLSADAFYAIGNDYHVVITTGTVNSVDYAGTVVGEFSIQNRSDQNIIPMIEYNRGHHTHTPTGKILYVDPINGATHASGARGCITDPYLTIQDCHDNAVTDSNHDIIILLPGQSGGPTTHTVAATTTISKRYTLLRGPGRDFIITRTGSGDTIALSGEGCEISGVQIETAAVGSGDGIAITGDFAFVHHCWLNDTQGEGININQAENCIIEFNRFQDTGAGGSGDGIQVNGTGSASSNNVIRHNTFEDVQGDAIRINGGTIVDTVIQGNTIHGSSGWGVNITASSAVDTFISDNRFGNNSSGNINDDGTTTIQTNNEFSLEVENATWDTLLTGSSHNISTSAGRRLRVLASVVVRNNTAQGSGTGNNQIQFDTGASATDGAYDPALVAIIAGTGTGQMRLILQYDGASKTATVDRNWKVNPDATSEFNIIADAGREHVNEGLAQAGAPTTITLNALASASDDVYNDQTIFIRSGTGEDQAKLVVSYDGTTKIATVDSIWDTTPDSTSGYVMLPTSLARTTQIKKNKTLDDFMFLMVDASDDPAAGLTVLSQRSLDGAAFAVTANSVTEISSGMYKIDLAATDLNADTVTLRFTATGAKDRLISIVTQP